MKLQCSVCSSPITNKSKSGLCGRCSLGKNRCANPKIKWLFTPEIETELRRAYAASSRSELQENLKFMRRNTGWPAHMISWHAGRLGLTKETRQRWTPEDIAIVRESAGVLHVSSIARRLGRSHSSIQNAIRRLGAWSRVMEGYTMEEAAEVLGVKREKVSLWVRCGWLEFSDTSSRIPESSMKNFIHEHPDHYDLRRVDQAWFKGVLFPDSFGGHTRGEVRDSLGAIRGSQFQQSLGN